MWGAWPLFMQRPDCIVGFRPGRARWSAVIYALASIMARVDGFATNIEGSAGP